MMMMSKNVRSSDLIDATKLQEDQHQHQLYSCGSKQYCPCCGHKFEAKPDWVGLPAGVKFDPTDQELIEHLEAKVDEAATAIIIKSQSQSQSHPLIDEFILTIEGEDGICYTHPEKLPGVTKDGLSRHFFHRPSKAYTTGTRKRRKIIQTELCDHKLQHQGGETRWHKTGKTRGVMVNGKQKGCKKILVLYTNFGKNRKPEKTNWVMHQYHLGEHEEEREGELVVSKIFYQTQPRQCNWSTSSSDHNNNTSASASTDQVGIISNNSTNTIMMMNGSTSNINTGISCSSSTKEIVTHGSDDFIMSAAAAAADGSTTVPYHHHHLTTSTTNIQHHLNLKSHHFTFIPTINKTTFDQVGMGEVLTAREVQACEELGVHEATHDHDHDHADQQINIIANINTPNFHMICSSSRPSISPLHHNNSYVSTLMLQNQNNYQQQHDDHKLGGRSASAGLEELIMGCTSTSTSTSTHHHINPKEVDSSKSNQEEAEWLKYSCNYWPAPPPPAAAHHNPAHSQPS